MSNGFNDDGLGAAMEASGQRDRAERLEQRLTTAENVIVRLVDQVERLSAALKLMSERMSYTGNE